MKVEGTHTVNAPRQQVYDTLMDTSKLPNCLPGCEKFEEVGEGRYDTTLKAGLAGIKGTFTGTVTLSDASPPESYVLAVEGAFSGGHVKGMANIVLEEQGNGTLIRYSGDGQISGRLASVGQRLMAPAARKVIGQFFKCMEGQLGT